MHNAGEQAIFATAAKQELTEISPQNQICFGKTEYLPVKARQRKQ
jgi:hypothetical protein